MRTLILATTLCIAVTGVRAAAAVTVYKDAAAFAAVRHGLKAVTFPFPYDPNDPFTDYRDVPSPYTRGGFTFSGSLTLYGDAGEYLAGHGGLLIAPPAGTYSLALVHGDYYGGGDSISINGVVVTTEDALDEGKFAGFTSDVPITSVLLSGGRENDLSYIAASGAVPEPADWALLTVGFGAIGIASRRAARVLRHVATPDRTKAAAA